MNTKNMRKEVWDDSPVFANYIYYVSVIVITIISIGVVLVI